MKIELDDRIRNQFPVLKYILLVTGCAKGMAIVSWLIYCIALPYKEADQLGFAVFIIGSVIMFASMHAYSEIFDKELNFSDIARYLFKSFCWIAGVFLGFALLLKYFGIAGLFGMVLLIGILIVAVWLRHIANE